jgi:site-specific DNA-methyltransferase (adenine-specific)
MDAIASADTPFGFASNFNDFRLTGKRRNDISIFAVQKMKRVVGYLDRSVVFKNSGAIDSWKVFLPLAGSDPRDIPDQVIGKAEVAPPPSICTQTYRYFGPFIDQNEATNFAIYLRTRFARFMISLRKNSHNTYGHTFAWVPLQDFSKPITDAELFKKYGITKDEQAYISEMIKEMP